MITFESVTREFSVGNYQHSTLKELFSFQKKRTQPGKIYRAVDDVSFSITPGQAVGVLGRNGAGKSTLLKLLTRIIAPSSGKITVDGSISCLLEVGAGFHHELSGYENIFLSGSILGMSRKEIETKIESIIEFAEVRDFIYEPVKYYSSGMYVRLAFSIGVHLDSEILVIDEALAVGDANFQAKCLNKINQVKESGKTIFFVSHNVNQVESICDACLVMEKGQLIYQGDTSKAVEIYNQLIK
ncbi:MULTISPECIES: ABC transporter ATP-binding protein [Pantoea]|jgi:ABC-type polysaccharide/polyol phosphate transport system ATPase subunit|uniref:ABC-type polysaccharide/polyol phosphate transport system ATPase subunit n=1 Tax=[Curtobacterium] plantarum TaxID=221276 RepID=A0ABT9T7Q7_9GAMM|nr:MULTISPECIES: ABC transporter ATP-binding protein [Pantoea]AYP22704.1 ABC transporter ATP-binding protein [Pantoea agglomerans]KGD76893.1 teichoic acid ABC transporter ATP-binding protein [Pantoea agglomerans]MCL9650437.1 ABC transporter ATP-binding protein [Pantoea agglomerans]MCW0973120.1 ABC transporter ATP-binding protein [Pantoea sp. JV6]MDQ0019501.1 ABC-type polysaccharide/polyol phosphate transport system ATPase subunit [[Curtobacterium] plantarum]